VHWLIKNIIISTLLAVGVTFFIFYSETGSWPIIVDYWQHFVVVILGVNLGGIILFIINKHLNQKIPWNKNQSIRFLIETLSGLLVFGILALIFIYGYIGLIIPTEEISMFWTNYWDGVVKFGILTLVIIYIIALVNFSIFSYNQYAFFQIETIRVEQNQLKLQFEALKSQLSPHFLFNALNTISSLIYKDTNISEEFIRKLSSTYKYILKTDDFKLVKLEEELEMVKSYFFMQKIKYESCIDLEISLSPILSNTFIPPLTLQMLVENALKHNLICDESVLKIEIFDENLKHIVVQNNFIQKPELLKIGNNLVDRPGNGDSHKIGLKNIQSRYNYFSGKDIEIKFDSKFIVKLPIIKNKLEA